MSLLFNLSIQHAVCSIFQITYVHNSLNQHFNKGGKKQTKTISHRQNSSKLLIGNS